MHTKQLDQIGMLHLLHYRCFLEKVVQIHRIFLQFSANENNTVKLSGKKKKVKNMRP